MYVLTNLNIELCAANYKTSLLRAHMPYMSVGFVRLPQFATTIELKWNWLNW